MLAQVEREKEALEEEVATLKKAIDRPIYVNLPANPAMQQIVTYLPQITQIATNLSFTASAIQAQNAVLERIAKALEAKP